MIELALSIDEQHAEALLVDGTANNLFAKGLAPTLTDAASLAIKSMSIKVRLATNVGDREFSLGEVLAHDREVAQGALVNAAMRQGLETDEGQHLLAMAQDSHFSTLDPRTM